MKKDYTKIITVLDESGSMASVRTDTMGGYNNFIEEQRKVPGTADVTLITFNSRPTCEYSGVPINSPEVILENYSPKGNTALYDAIGLAITQTGNALAALPENERPEKVVMVIITDGQENASTDYTRKQINEMITHQREKYSWQFVFLGANQDAFATSRGLGIACGSSSGYAATGDGTRLAFANTSKSINRYRVGGASASVNYSEEEREAFEKSLTK